MSSEAHILQNNLWQAGILPDTGGSIAFGRVRYSGAWVDILRPTPPDGYYNSSRCSSFIMLPWANRIKDGVLRFDGRTYGLMTADDDNTARHGAVRGLPWIATRADEQRIRLLFDDEEHDDVNWPFPFQAMATYSLDGADFIWDLSLTNTGDVAFPAGFGHHPYFVTQGAMPALQVPCDQQFELTRAMATGAPIPIKSEVDFRKMRPVPDDLKLDDLLTHRQPDEPVRLRYDDWNLTIEMHADPIFKHILVFTAPDGTLAVEPQTNANDGFNLYANGIEGSGVFVVQPGETVSGQVRLRVVTD